VARNGAHGGEGGGVVDAAALDLAGDHLITVLGEFVLGLGGGGQCEAGDESPQSDSEPLTR
jgi:hypothetical protein